MQHQRIFLGLQQPPLISAVQWLYRQFVSPQKIDASTTMPLFVDDQSVDQGGFDLGELIIVLPTRRSKRRLEQLLMAKAKSNNVTWQPPTLATVGELPEYLYQAAKPIATDLVQQIAWAEALAKLSDEAYHRLTGLDPDQRPSDWQVMAGLMARLHNRLGNDIWSFRSVAREVNQIPGFLQQEAARWEVLETVQTNYYRILEDLNLWDRQAARNFAAASLLKEGKIYCQTDKTIVMLGVADLNRSLSEMLRQITTSDPTRLIVLIAAEQAMESCFDPFGSLVTQAWLDRPIPIQDSRITMVNQATDQADAVTHFLSEYGDYATDEITIGVLDESLTPQIQRSMQQVELPHQSLAGVPLAVTAPIKLMAAIREYLRTESYEAFSSLVRQPDLFDWLSAAVDNGQWLSDLTEFQNFNLPDTIPVNSQLPFGDAQQIVNEFDADDISSQRRAVTRAESADRLNQIFFHLHNLLSLVIGARKPACQWAEAWSEIIRQVFSAVVEQGSQQSIPGGSNYDSTNNQPEIKQVCQQTFSAYRSTLKLLDAVAQIPPQLARSSSALDALGWCLKASMEHRILLAGDPVAIELTGWLDLTLDDAPVMIITGMNEEFVPATEKGHLFLPNELCRQLQILDNDRRLARDIYALTIIVSVREEYRLMLSRFDDQQEPQKPSRLLFFDQPEVAARRAQAFFEFEGPSMPIASFTDPAPRAKSQSFLVPRPVITSPVTKISVTKFRDYLKCPYRFYLKHVMNLEGSDDDAKELDAGQFGDLIHNCLEAFGKSPISDSTTPDRIYQFLMEQLDLHIGRLYRGQRLPAVDLQIAQIRLRFQNFSEKQAAHRDAGWKIVSTEEMLEHAFDVDGQPFFIRGKIDRIDRHQQTGQVAIWDYKSGDEGKTPTAFHYSRRKREWLDLQLPLYRHLAKEVAVIADADWTQITTGYVLLPRKLDQIDFVAADFSEEELNQADEVARDVLRKIRENYFWPPNPIPPKFSEEFASICQDHVFEKASTAL